MTNKSLNLRALASLLGAAGLPCMGFSGLIAYFMPQGCIAYWTDWHLLGLTKTQWGAIHIISSILFLVVAGFHLYFNWKPFLNYIKGKAAQIKGRKKELWKSVAALILVVVAGTKPFPPLSWLLAISSLPGSGIRHMSRLLAMRKNLKRAFFAKRSACQLLRNRPY